MIEVVKQSLWKQFGASMDMLEHAITRCSDAHWEENRKLFFQTYHVLVFLDLYLTVPAGPMVWPLPFRFASPAEMPAGAIDDLVPLREYTRKELLDYLTVSREKCRMLIAGLTEEKLGELWVEDEPDGRSFAVLELLLYNMRHVQHHAAQMNLLLRQGINDAPRWVSRTKVDL